jgi:hypothetical protein
MSKKTSIGDRDYGMAEVLNVSGNPGDDLRSLTPPQAQQAMPPPGHRSPVEIDARDGRRLDSYLAQGVAHAAHREQQEHFARQRDTSPGAYMAHLFGRNRDRA